MIIMNKHYSTKLVNDGISDDDDDSPKVWMSIFYPRWCSSSKLMFNDDDDIDAN